jgi:hypothetical protein
MIEIFNMIYFVILCIPHINSFKDIYFVGSPSYPVLYIKYSYIFRKKKLIKKAIFNKSCNKLYTLINCWKIVGIYIYILIKKIKKKVEK